MTKEEENTVKTGIVVRKSDFKKALSAHKKFALQGKNVEKSPLSWINFKTKDDVLKLTTTDGSRALLSELTVFTSWGDDFDFCISMSLASKLSLIKGDLDDIRIRYCGTHVEFFDEEFESNQILQTKPTDIAYPDIESLIPAKNNYVVSIVKTLIKDISALNSKVVDLRFQPKSPEAPILVEAGTEEFSQRAILMPYNKNPN